MAAKIFASALVIVVVSVLIGMQWKTNVVLPSHLLNNKVFFEEELISAEVGASLRELIKESAEFPSNSNDLLFYKTVHEHIGEAEPIEADGSCKHRFLVPNTAKTHCILPGRFDVARHWLQTGGLNGLKEPFESMVSRVLSFGQYNWDITKNEVIRDLFSNQKFLNAAKQVCPSDKQYLDPFQYNFIIQLPGQTVAMHIDGPYFWGANRFQFPQWLLAVMVFSGLFEDRFIDQVQVVSYLHQWTHTAHDGGLGGDFVYWNTADMKPKRVPPTPLAGSAVDGSKTVHAAEVYRPSAKMPIMSKDKSNVLRYVGNESWVLYSDNTPLQSYHTDDLRISVVYRARCFASESEAARYANQDSFMQLDDVLDTLQADMIQRGTLSREHGLNKLDLAMRLVDEYIVYPYPDTVIPFNYCMLPKLFPPARHVLWLLC